VVYSLVEGSSPGGGDEGVDGDVDGHDFGVVLRVAVHGAEDAFAGGHQDPHRTVQAVHPTGLRLVQRRHH